MTFEQLEYFIAVAETDTFYTAADILHMTQSALSKQIMKLEKELDVQLFDRTHRSAQLTYAGKVFYEEAQKLVLQYRKTLNRMEHIKSPVGEALAIGTLPVLDAFGLRRPLHEFKTRHTESRITIDEVEEQERMFGLDSSETNTCLPAVPSHFRRLVKMSSSPSFLRGANRTVQYRSPRWPIILCAC